MNIQQYQQGTLRTESMDLSVIRQRLDNDDILRLMHAVIGLSTEAGELGDILKKYLFYGKPLHLDHVQEELGDLLWYAAVACNALGLDLASVLQSNTEKLKVRYPDAFTEQDALSRKDQPVP